MIFEVIDGLMLRMLITDATFSTPTEFYSLAHGKEW